MKPKLTWSKNKKLAYFRDELKFLIFEKESHFTVVTKENNKHLNIKFSNITTAQRHCERIFENNEDIKQISNNSFKVFIQFTGDVKPSPFPDSLPYMPQIGHYVYSFNNYYKGEILEIGHTELGLILTLDHLKRN